MCMTVLLESVMYCFQRPEETVGFLGTGLTNGCKIHFFFTFQKKKKPIKSETLSIAQEKPGCLSTPLSQAVQPTGGLASIQLSWIQ